jgi:hypothetical protein
VLDGERAQRLGALSMHGPPYSVWALIEAAHNAIC